MAHFTPQIPQIYIQLMDSYIAVMLFKILQALIYIYESLWLQYRLPQFPEKSHMVKIALTGRKKSNISVTFNYYIQK